MDEGRNNEKIYAGVTKGWYGERNRHNFRPVKRQHRTGKEVDDEQDT